MKVLILYPEPVVESHWLYKEIKNILNKKEITVEVYGSKTKNSQLRKYKTIGWLMIQFFQFWTAFGGILHTKQGDIIISGDFGTARICSALTVIFRKKRKIMALNCLQRGNHGIKYYVEKALNYLAWKNDNFITTVNHEEEMKKIVVPSDKMDRVYILEDTFQKENFSDFVTKKDFDCMTGGYANRDFATFFEIARRESAMKFCCVVGSNFRPDLFDIPNNCSLFKDVSEKDFFQLMESSRVISVPLLEDIVSGLVVFKNAIRFGILPIASRTAGICNYVPNDMIDELTFEIGDVDGFQNRLKSILRLDSLDYDQRIHALQKYNEKYSPQKQCEKIVKYIEDNEWF